MNSKHNTNWQDFRSQMLATSEAQTAYNEAERAWQLKELLIKAREQANLTQSELAKRLDIAPSNLSRMEKTPHKTNLQTLFKYLDACNAKLEFNLTY